MRLKKFSLIVLAFSLCIGASAQISTLMPLVLGDTIANTGTVTKTVRVTTGPSGIVLHTELFKLSGTGAGTVQLQLSNSGVTYVNSGSAYTITNTFPQAAEFTITAPVPEYVRLLYTGTGTESVQVRVYYRAPKYQGIQGL